MNTKNIKAWAVVAGSVGNTKAIISLHETREEARKEKAVWGGKENNVSIFKMQAVGEVR